MKRKHKWLPGDRGIDKHGDVYEYLPEPKGEIGGKGYRFRLLSTTGANLGSDWVGTVFWLSEKECPVPCRLRSPDEESFRWGYALGILAGSLPVVGAIITTSVLIGLNWGMELAPVAAAILIGSQWCIYRVTRETLKEESSKL